MCKVYVKGFDHHCPAFGNCIGNNSCVSVLLFWQFFSSFLFDFITKSFRIWWCTWICMSRFTFVNFWSLGAGRENRVLFITLLVGFILSEASYIACLSQCKLDYSWFTLLSVICSTWYFQILHLEIRSDILLNVKHPLLMQIWFVECIRLNWKVLAQTF